MLNLLVGMGIGYIAFTENGRKLGNRVANMATSHAKKVLDDVKAVAKNAKTGAAPDTEPPEPARYPDSSD